MTATQTAEAPTLRVEAHYVADYNHADGTYTHHTDKPQSFRASADFITRDDAEAFRSLFPKSAKLHVSRLSGSDTANFIVIGTTKLASDGVNDGVNETGIRRYRSIIRAATKAGVHIEWATGSLNSYQTRWAFESAIA